MSAARIAATAGGVRVSTPTAAPVRASPREHTEAIWALQRSAGNRAVARLIQAARAPQAPRTHQRLLARKIYWDDDLGEFARGERRRGWTAATHEAIRVDYNARQGTSYTGRPPGIDYSHKGSYADIEDLVCAYCNGRVTDDELATVTDEFFPDDRTELWARRKSLWDCLHPLYGSRSEDAIADAANELVHLLNNAAEMNLGPGVRHENRGIGRGPDLRYVRVTPGGSAEPSPRSASVAGALDWAGYLSDFPTTPSHAHLRTSQFDSIVPHQGQPVPVRQVKLTDPKTGQKYYKRY